MATTPEHAPQIPHIRLPDIKGGLRWARDNSLTLGIALAIAAGSTYFIASHDQKPPIRPTTGVSDTIKPPESEFVVVPAVPTEAPPTATASPPPEPPKPEPTATIEPIKVLPTPTEATTGTGSPPPPKEEPPTPEVKKDVPCAILPQEFCSQAEVIDWTFQGQTDKLIGFHLPPGVPIFSPEDGYLSSGKESEPFAGKLAIVHNLQDPASTVFHFSGDFNMVPSNGNIKKNDIIARTQDTGVKMFGDYNLILMVSKRNPNGSGFIIDDEVLKELSRR